MSSYSYQKESQGSHTVTAASVNKAAVQLKDNRSSGKKQLKTSAPVNSDGSSIQFSLLGKAGTMLGTGIAAGAGALGSWLGGSSLVAGGASAVGSALGGVGLSTLASGAAAVGSMVAGASLLAGATAGALGYLAYKKMFGGPFIGGHHNIDVLQQGKGQRTSMGVGLVNKGHLFSHSVASVNGIAMDQQLNGGLSTQQLLTTVARPLDIDDAGATLGHFEGFNAKKGRLATVNVPMHNSAMALTRVNQLTREERQYRLLSNSCSSNVGDVMTAGGLQPPAWVKTPTQMSLWMKSLSKIQKHLVK
ncbi:hypothetical protein VRU48_05210 [Pedobacter sp. KR3-3]|uniref:Uncharacterized protein n=1 Tax=Pedobacter albus TaxID=3113905 RepID=A0ABU7I585_9SPHI|nr:hypothetical protein [Pedobacter sp. KR3-3]MEE1944496.1 hypothetical protein [Pedobacter sp. KR3-3]